MKLALISPPFSDASWPSIQLAVLEAYVQRHRPGDTVALVHHSLEVAAAVGPTRYDLLAWRPFAAEAVYAALRFDSMAESALGLLESELASGGDPVPDRKALLQQLIMPARRATERLARRLTADRHDVIGISVCLAQLLPSIYLAKRLCALRSSAKIVLGGSAVGSLVGERLLRAFDEIDYVVDGEGERPLVALLNHLEHDAAAEPDAVPGLVYRRPDGSVRRNPVDQIRDLSELPAIGYASYFEERARLEPGLPALRPPTLLIESSRGCWWDRSKKRPDQICAFCNLNVQWEGYREKPNERVIAEVEALTREHRCLELGFVDNILRYKGGKALFDGLAALGRDLSISYELRASIRDEELVALKRAGGREVQVGIEALSTPLLETMVKGTTAAQNVWVMRRTEELGLRNNANLILGHPGSTAADLRDTLAAIPQVRHLYPLVRSGFWLGLGSLVERQPERYGVTNLRVHDAYRALIPSEILDSLTLLERSYDSPGAEDLDWKPIEVAMGDWKRRYESHHSSFDRPMLELRDGGDFMVIADRRGEEGLQRTTTLGGNMAALYRFLNGVRTRKEIQERFPLAQPSDMENTIARLVEGGLVFDDQGRRSVALAVRMGPGKEA